MSKERLETFSDAVFAIILTLLVLELQVPTITNHASLGTYAQAMLPLIPKFFSFILTFVIIAIHWVGHHFFFRHVRNAPLGLVWLNNLLLLWLCLLPFPTALLGDHPTDQFPIIVFAVNSLFVAVSFMGLRIYASRNHLFIDSQSAKAMGPRHSLPSIGLFFGAILLSFINVYLSLLCLFLVPLPYFVPNLIETKFSP